jgi:hypothetical protein
MYAFFEQYYSNFNDSTLFQLPAISEGRSEIVGTLFAESRVSSGLLASLILYRLVFMSAEHFFHL